MIDITTFEKGGFVITGPLFSLPEVQRITASLKQRQHNEPGPRRGGLRDVLDNLPAVRDLADHTSIRKIAERVLGSGAFVVRATLFDKTETSNWKVPWHQDVTIAVAERVDTPGYGQWSVKADVTHVQPPSHILESMVSIRIHLDDCPASNGALRVMPGTHKLGKLNQNDVSPYVNEANAICCEVRAGEALIMRPLVLHASSAAKNPGHRRVVHFDFAIDKLPDGMIWRMQS